MKDGNIKSSFRVAMSKNFLVISLFVHDMKAPLSVVASGATRLERDMEQSGYEIIGRKLVSKIKHTRQHAGQLLNHILTMDESDGISCTISDNQGPSSIISRLLNRTRSFLLVRRSIEQPLDICQAILELKTYLITLLELINALEIQAGYAETGRHGNAVIKRMRRNAKTAIHLADNAIAILVSHKTDPVISTCTLSQIIRPVLIEVFDLLDPKISDRIDTIGNINDLNELLSNERLILSIDETCWSIRLDCDHEKIRQVLLNLLLNAMKFRADFVNLEVFTNKDQLIFNVIDDGEGIPEADQPHIFEKRFQVKSEKVFPIRGHGIGLAGAQALLESLGGQLCLESSRKGKTCFSAICKI